MASMREKVDDGTRRTTINLSTETRDAIFRLKQRPSDTYEDVLVRELDLDVDRERGERR